MQWYILLSSIICICDIFLILSVYLCFIHYFSPPVCHFPYTNQCNISLYLLYMTLKFLSSSSFAFSRKGKKTTLNENGYITATSTHSITHDTIPTLVWTNIVNMLSICACWTLPIYSLFALIIRLFTTFFGIFQLQKHIRGKTLMMG